MAHQVYASGAVLLLGRTWALLRAGTQNCGVQNLTQLNPAGREDGNKRYPSLSVNHFDVVQNGLLRGKQLCQVTFCSIQRTLAAFRPFFDFFPIPQTKAQSHYAGAAVPLNDLAPTGRGRWQTSLEKQCCYVDTCRMAWFEDYHNLESLSTTKSMRSSPSTSIAHFTLARRPE